MSMKDWRNSTLRITTVSSRKIPDQWKLRSASPFENHAISAHQLLIGEKTSKRIFDVRIGSCLVDHEITSRDIVDGHFEPFEILRPIGSEIFDRGKEFPGDVMFDPSQPELLDDIRRSITVMSITIEDTDRFYLSKCLQFEGCHHQAIEGAEIATETIPCMMKS